MDPFDGRRLIVRNSKTRGLMRGAMTALLVAGLAATPAHAQKRRKSADLDAGMAGPVQGVGIESRDLLSMADQMVRDILAQPVIAARATAPRVIVDSRYFTNESSQRINANLITDRLRTSLNRASDGRLVFLARQNAAMIEEERALKREGVTDSGTAGMTQAQFGGDFRLTGNIASQDARSSRTGTIQRFTQITFELVDLESGAIVWSNGYDISRAATDDVVYR
ncbi:penicillin-binding protein activator LpoB [Tsuneonella sp. YG55]|uniref:Penicillin-binding protein activator LpoB n=1 Tax=Tsuneonella litorea TaxID=2976475 RepID=A0A9X2W2G8_9SPHN|nr:penicillin-binding protein activator LpoB [Tsuneonella litorea]MCT2559364.1 penicillin-binding protein activator LpoB [Tsuneonella litorea]